MQQRTLDEPLMTFSLLAEIPNIKSSAQWKASGIGSITLVKNDALSITLVVLSKGMALQEHQAEGQITVSMVEVQSA